MKSAARQSVDLVTRPDEVGPFIDFLLGLHRRMHMKFTFGSKLNSCNIGNTWLLFSSHGSKAVAKDCMF